MAEAQTLGPYHDMATPQPLFLSLVRRIQNHELLDGAVLFGL